MSVAAEDGALRLGIEKPDVEDQHIISALREQYDLAIVALAFLPVGADRNSASYRATAEDSTGYFVKVRQGPFDETSVLLPRFLADHGVLAVIPPLESKAGRLWSSLGSAKLILYPFIAGLDGYDVEMSEGQWRDLGRALKMIHAVELPQALRDKIRKETYAFPWGEILRTRLDRAGSTTPRDPISRRLAQFLKEKEKKILDLIQRAETLAGRVRDRCAPLVLCHSDVHAGNVLIAADGRLCIVDWDDPILAPKERDLMFIGGGYWGNGQMPEDGAAWFYRGYGQAPVDPFLIAYYRYARIVEDLAIFSTRIFEAREGNADRELSLHYLTTSFLPDSAIERAYALDRSRRANRDEQACGDRGPGISTQPSG
jgi:spectinomycin phosphotransferase